ncbi:MAG: hypothetical protein ING36_13365 [Burkholderiales bacterium]|nr:hypothetical protein [Burkholderiales bacterium]
MYEFASCEPGSKVINVMHVPRGFQSRINEDKLIRDDQPIGWREKDPLGESWTIHNGGFSWTVLYTTYPEFDSLGSTPWRDLAKREDASKKVEFGYIEFGYGQVTKPHFGEFVHDPKAIRKNWFERIREESIDGQYWAYPPHNQRTTKATGRPMYFMPKDTGINVTIGCKDTGVNNFPEENMFCDLQSQFIEDISLKCMLVGYRIQVKDIPRWREFDARVKQRIKSMITQRIHGYTEPINKVEK